MKPKLPRYRASFHGHFEAESRDCDEATRFTEYLISLFYFILGLDEGGGPFKGFLARHAL